MRQFTKTGLLVIVLIVGAVIFAELTIYSIKIISEFLYKALNSPREAVIVLVTATTFLGLYLEFRN
jgi:hypothetical protein